MPGENVPFNLLLITFTIFRSSQIVFQGRNGEAERAVHTLESCPFCLRGSRGLIHTQWTWERQVVPDTLIRVAVCKQCLFVLGMGVLGIATRWAAARDISLRQGWVPRTWSNSSPQSCREILEDWSSCSFLPWKSLGLWNYSQVYQQPDLKVVKLTSV